MMNSKENEDGMIGPEYPKIESLFNRDPQSHKFIIGDWRAPEFEALYDIPWMSTEKIDGTNVRIMWDGHAVTFAGRTGNASLPATLVNELNARCRTDHFNQVFPPEKYDKLCIYAEGFGRGIQAAGRGYLPQGVDFAVFDIWIGNYWLEWHNVVDVCEKLNLNHVPVLGEGALLFWCEQTRQGFPSKIGGQAEGVVARPARVDLYTRGGQRIIVKMKTKDFLR